VQDVHDAVLPADDLKVPIGQSVQAPETVLSVAPSLEYLPAGQRFAVNVVQEEAPAREYVPNAQVPVQADVCNPVVAPYTPAGQLLHVVRT
jgi:hypothetical protein